MASSCSSAHSTSLSKAPSDPARPGPARPDPTRPAARVMTLQSASCAPAVRAEAEAKQSSPLKRAALAAAAAQPLSGRGASCATPAGRPVRSGPAHCEANARLTRRCFEPHGLGQMALSDLFGISPQRRAKMTRCSALYRRKSPASVKTGVKITLKY